MSQQNVVTSIFKNDFLKGNETRNLKQGDVIISEGDPSNEYMYFVLDGTLGVYKNLKNNLEQINVLSMGDFFGEIALISNQPRSATVKVTSPTAYLMLISKAKFVEQTRVSPALMFSIFKALIVRMLRAETNFDTYIKRLGGIKQEILLKLNQNRVRTININIIDYLKNLPNMTLTAGQQLSVEGEVSKSTMFFVFKGKLDAFKMVGERNMKVATYESGDFFGETSVVTDRLRPYTVTVSSEKAIVTPIDKSVFMKIMQISPEFLFNQAKAIIWKLINTEKITFQIKAELEARKQDTDIKTMKKGERIISEGDASNETMYFILDGLVSVFKNINDKMEEVNTLRAGEFFGELSLISKQPRTATIAVKSESATLILLSKDKFIQQTKANPSLMVSILKATIARLFRAEVSLEKLIKRSPEIDPDMILEMHEGRVDNLNIVNYVHNLHQKLVHQGDIVFKEGDKPEETIYFISSGELAVTRMLGHKKMVIAKYEPGDFFGEAAIITNIPRYMTVEVMSEKAKVLAIQKDIFLKIVKMNPSFLFGLLRTVVWKLIITERTINKLNIQFDLYMKTGQV